MGGAWPAIVSITSEDRLYDSVRMLDASAHDQCRPGRYDFEREPIVRSVHWAHPMIHLAGAGSLRATLWEVDSDRMIPSPTPQSIPPSELGIGTIHGDLLILREGESSSARDVTLHDGHRPRFGLIDWAMRVLTGQDSLILSGEVDPVPISGNTTMSASMIVFGTSGSQRRSSHERCWMNCPRGLEPMVFRLRTWLAC